MKDPKICSLLKMSPFLELNYYDKEILISNCNNLTQIDSAIPKLFQCYDYNNYNELSNIQRIISICKPLPLVEALKLLSGDFLCDSIRKYAVQSCTENIIYLQCN